MPALTIFIEGKTHTLEKGETMTFKCYGFPMVNNFYVTFHTKGYFTYGGITYSGSSGKKAGLSCSNKVMNSNIVVTADEPSDTQRAIAIYSESEMLSLLNNADLNSIGSIYKYVGKTSNIFERDALYMIDKVN